MLLGEAGPNLSVEARLSVQRSEMDFSVRPPWLPMISAAALAGLATAAVWMFGVCVYFNAGCQVDTRILAGVFQ